MVGLFFPKGASSFIPEWTTGYFDFSLFPVNLGVVILEPVVAEDQVLFPKSGDGQKHPFGVSLVPENYIYNFGNLTCFIGGTVDVEDQDVTREGPSIHSFRVDKISVDEASGCSGVQEGLDGVEFACVRSSDFYWQEKRSSSCVQGTNQEKLGQSLLLLGLTERSKD